MSNAGIRIHDVESVRDELVAIKRPDGSTFPIRKLTIFCADGSRCEVDLYLMEKEDENDE